MLFFPCSCEQEDSDVMSLLQRTIQVYAFLVLLSLLSHFFLSLYRILERGCTSDGFKPFLRPLSTHYLCREKRHALSPMLRVFCYVSA